MNYYNCFIDEQCFSLNCENFTCQCEYYYQYQNETTTVCNNKTLVETSCIENFTCRSDLGLYCQNGYCKCDSSIHFWYNNTIGCRNYLIYGESTCRSDSECDTSAGLVCNLNAANNNCTCPSISVNGMCDCPKVHGNETYWDALTLNCRPAFQEHALCANTYQCLKGMSCNATTNTCMCPFTRYYDYTSNSCASQTLNNTACLANNTCRVDLGLSCQNSRCQCSSPKFWLSGQCSDPLDHNQAGCTSDSHCRLSLGLICRGFPTLLTSSCSVTVVQGMCECPSDKYWSGSVCVTRLIEFQACTQNCQCSTNLICDLSCTQLCLNSSVTCTSGWIYFNGKCYRRIGDFNYANSVSNCLSLLPSKSSKIAVISDVLTMEYLTCKFGTRDNGNRAYISTDSTVSCSRSESCKTLEENECVTRWCSFLRYAICESLV
jgi:hypothetical protein